MTSRRDDMHRAAVAPLLNELRGELLVMPREQVVEDHLEMMAFEKQILATPRLVRRTRSSLVRPHRTAFVIACVCTTIASCGLSAAGALPEPLQHITDSIARTLGVPQPDTTPAPTHSVGAGTPHATSPNTAARPSASTATSPSVTPKVSAAGDAHAQSTGGSTTVAPPHTSGGSKVPQLPQVAKPRPTVPHPRRTPKPPSTPTPSRNGENTPPGYPKNWRPRAIDAATAQLQACSHAAALDPANCPQIATAAGDNASAQGVTWSLLNDPQSGAVAVARTKFGHTASGAPTSTTTVTVYERFQMDASYTEAGDPARAYLGYSAGIAQATMTWNGSSFQGITFASGSVAGHVLPGVRVTGFTRPADASDGSVLSAVLGGFDNCAAVMAPVTDPTPNCSPASIAAGQQWSLVGDPTQGAAVTFDRQQGDFTVTGTFAMTSAPDASGNPASANGQYTATLFFDGQQMQVLSISITS